MSGIMVAMAAMGRLSALLGVGNSAGEYGYFVSAYGTLSATALAPNTIDRVIWDNVVGGTVILSLHGTSVANTDATFAAILLDGRLLTRASATYTANDGSGRTQWAWSVNTSAYPISGTKSFSVN